MFYGREKELLFLDEKYYSQQSEFIVLYGRRRIGKTALLREFVKDKKHIFYSGKQVTDQIQLKSITPKITKYFNTKIFSDSFVSWDNLFNYIAENTRGEEKSVIILDEFPYIAENNTALPSILQNIWDHELSNKNVMLIISGSSMSFMEKKILSEKMPLFGRASGILKLKELDFFEAKAFMPNIDIRNQLTYYSIFSGVPHYLSLIDEKKSLRDNIKDHILSTSSSLFNEVEFLIKQELRETSKYISIIEVIAQGCTKVNQISQLTGIEKNKLSYYLNNLIELNFIRKEFPSTIKRKDIVKSRNGLYKLNNSFFRFYFKFVFPYIFELEEGASDILLDELIMDQINQFVSYEFENICIHKLRKKNQSHELPIRLLKTGRWWKKDIEIDIVAFDKEKNFIFGECKWRNQLLTSKVLDQLIEKTAHLDVEVKDKYFVLFSKSGFSESLLTRANEDKHVILIELEEFK